MVIQAASSAREDLSGLHRLTIAAAAGGTQGNRSQPIPLWTPRTRRARGHSGFSYDANGRKTDGRGSTAKPKVVIKADVPLVNAARDFVEAWLVRKNYDATVRPKASDTPSNPIPTSGKRRREDRAAATSEDSQNVPKNSR